MATAAQAAAFRQAHPERALATNRRYQQSEKGRAALRRGAAAARSRHRARTAEARAGGCVDCGGHDTLHFHHRDPATKLFKVSEMACRSDQAFWAEVAKCVVLCESCHIARHQLA